MESEFTEDSELTDFSASEDEWCDDETPDESSPGIEASWYVPLCIHCKPFRS